MDELRMLIFGKAKNDLKDKNSMYVRERTSITSAKRWVGGVRKWQFLLIYSTKNADVGGWVGLKKPKSC